VVRPREQSVHIIGVPLDLGAGRRGVDMGPSAFRIAGLGEQIRALGRVVVDKGNLDSPVRETLAEPDVRQKYVHEIAVVCRDLHDRALAALQEGAVPLVLGGDHSLGAGSVGATASYLKRGGSRPPGLLWIDAHGDMNTPETTLSGNVHGMPLASLLGSEPRALTAFAPFPTVRPEHTVLVGIRNLDEREKARLRASGVHVFTMKDIDRDGMATVAERALDIASSGTGGIHVSFDMDSCDPSIAPGVGTPVKGGLDYREAHLLMEIVADSGRLLALDLVEVNPTLDIRNTTAELGVELALSALGKSIL
jgi:arginase